MLMCATRGRMHKAYNYNSCVDNPINQSLLAKPILAPSTRFAFSMCMDIKKV